MRLYAYTTIFTIESSRDLDDFWGYIIERLQVESSQHTYNRLARLHNILTEQLKFISEEQSVTITLRESDLFFRFTIVTEIKSFFVSLISRFEHYGFEYRFENNILRYGIHKVDPKLLAPKQPKKEQRVFGFVNQDDLDEMSNILERLEDANYEKVYPSLSEDELSDYRSAFSYYASHLQFYTQLKHMYGIVAELSVLLSIYKDDCIALGNDMRALIYSFVGSLQIWQTKLFETGAEALSFMDDSFEADLAQIKLALNLYDEVEDDSSLDDIFDF
jgi:hypothetical protein